MWDDELRHHGILGQKWGVRRTPEQLGHKTAGSRKTGGNSSAFGQKVSETAKRMKQATHDRVVARRLRKALKNGKLSQYSGKQLEEMMARKEMEDKLLNDPRFDAKAVKERRTLGDKLKDVGSDFVKKSAEKLGELALEATFNNLINREQGKNAARKERAQKELQEETNLELKRRKEKREADEAKKAQDIIDAKANKEKKHAEAEANKEKKNAEAEAKKEQKKAEASERNELRRINEREKAQQKAYRELDKAADQERRSLERQAYKEEKSRNPLNPLSKSIISPYDPEKEMLRRSKKY